ncbi:MAG: ferredoxin--NADP reductase [Bacteroidota bacterium]
MMKSFLLPIADIRQETADTLTICFTQPKVDRIHYYAGQYLTIKVEIEEESYWRSYSISSTPGLEAYLSITVKRVPGGIVSNYIHDHWQVGTKVSFLRPSGRFLTHFSVKNTRHIWLWGAGSGITPLMSILKGILYQEPHSRVSLIYGNKTEEDIIFKDQLEELSDRFSDRLQVVHFLSRETNTRVNEARLGRLEDVGAIYEELREEPVLPETHFLCGPSSMMAKIQKNLRQLNVPAAAIKQEAFQVDEEMQTDQAAASGPTYKVKVKWLGEVHEVWVPPGQTLLDAGLAQGLDFPYACKRGTCATCMGRLKTGEVKMQNPAALLDFEVELGKILVCQTIPISEDIEIEIGV